MTDGAMTNHPTPPPYRDRIVSTLSPVRPLLPPMRRVWLLMPLGILLAASGPLISGGRGDLSNYAPLLTYGALVLQSMLGLWLLALGFREAVPGRSVSTPVLAVAAMLTGVMVASITLLTNAASPTVTPAGREWRDWIECVMWPATLGAPFMIAATLMAIRAFPTRPAIAGGLCGLSAGVLSEAGWRLSCWISDPLHIVESHGLAMIALTAGGALLAVVSDMRRWRD
ncbi:MAG TPA: NrsF family protein [Vicinamibacterales bacterium]|nr:NrsF family protein [Vicinamibacterales bacterium]